MPELGELRDQLRQVRGLLQATTSGLASAREQLRHVDARQQELARVFDSGVPAQVAERDRLEAERGRVEAELKRLGDTRAEATRRESSLRAAFAELSDPRTASSELNDATPILLMPVRLETRFKDVQLPGAAAPTPQLWVRIYPDDCWVDAFDPRLTESEAAGARAYWIAMWEAGGIEPQERAAWRSLVRSHGAGRAGWIVEQFRPLNVAQKPTKARPEDVVLTIATEAPMPSAEEAAAAAFWRQAWLADGDTSKLTAAHAALTGAVGAARAAQIVSRHRPDNFETPLAEGIGRQAVSVQVAQVVFGVPDTIEQAWSGAPAVTILPDRFVFVGYRGSEPPVVAVGQPVPSSVIVAPDPSAPPEEQLRQDASGNLIFPEPLAWIADFEKAEAIGMAIRVELSEAQRVRGFDRILVVGLRVSADENVSQTELETLLRHHAFSRSGLSLLPQGTPTNNTDVVQAGGATVEASSSRPAPDSADESFDDRRAPLFTPASTALDKKDGQLLAEALGVEPSLFAHVHHADGTDGSTSRAMGVALWPATMGYWMESMMAPVFPHATVDVARTFFTRYVVASGSVPAIRIGSQPYGILPTAAVSRMRWMFLDDEAAARDPLFMFCHRMYPIVRSMQQDWRAQAAHVAFTGKPGDPHQMLLDILGLHSGSVEWYSRYAEAQITLFNRLNLQGFGDQSAKVFEVAQRQNALDLLVNLGFGGAGAPKILDHVFSAAPQLLKGGVVDDRPLSELEGIRPYTTAGANYIEWLIDAASTSLERLYTQGDFIGGQPPAALLYLLLRHALQLGYHEASVGLHQMVGIYTAERAAAARIDQPIIHVGTAAEASESRYEPLFSVQPSISGLGSTVTVGEFIGSRVRELGPASHLREQIDALERMKAQPTARLERAFADHVDCCSYRLDAWLLGLVNYQLATMRRTHDGQEGPSRGGVYLGGYGWLEDVRPKTQSSVPVALDDHDLATEFEEGVGTPLVRESGNQGFVHAPSLNQAVAAAVLRNGYISTATADTHDTLAVNLTSERVRTAMSLLEGIRAGQGLGDLLGYQFERGLHDRHGMAEVDKFIYPLRKAFPLRADRLQSTATPEGVPIEAIEARNVIDGLALAEHINATGARQYPFDKPGLPTASGIESAAISAEADRLLASCDALADLALAEGVYQAVVGNVDRAAANYDAYARGGLPPEPEIIRTPASGFGLTHRVALHLAAGVDPNRSPDPALAMTPRAQIEPAINAWLTTVLPPLSTIGCVAEFHDAADGTLVAREVTLDRLGLQPADLLALAGGAVEAIAEIDDRIVDLIGASVRPDLTLSIRYTQKGSAALSLFEVLPLVRSLRSLTLGARPLRSTDLSLASEARSIQDAAPVIDGRRAALVEGAMRGLATEVAAFTATLEGLLSQPAAQRAELLAAADTVAANATALLARAALFGVPQTGRQFVLDFKRRLFADLLGQTAQVVTRWDARLAQFDARIAAHDALPGETSNAERFRILAEAEVALRTTPLVPRPGTAADLRSTLMGTTRPAFVALRDRLAGLQGTERTRVADLLAHVRAIGSLSEFDPVPFSLGAHENAVVHFFEDARAAAASVGRVLTRRLSDAAPHLQAAGTSVIPVDAAREFEAAAKALLGDDVVVVPEFVIAPSQGGELANALAASRSGALFDDLVHPPNDRTPAIDFPVDTWLHGAARVRERLRAWEQVTILAGVFGRPEPPLDALQLPHVPGDRWFGLDVPEHRTLEGDRLLYTAHFAGPFDPAQRVCGLLLDEWTEIIPAAEVDTGIAVHYDRPNAEAPQTMLLVTPTEFRGAWQWDDIVDALNDTLNLAKQRAVEPAHLAQLPYAGYLPATIMASQVRQLTIAANLALNNQVVLAGG